MPEVEREVPEIYLQPGEMHLALKPTIIRTLLGSCVGATFWSARLGVGALCHALLPRCPENSSRVLHVTAGARYVDFAIRELARQFDQLGANRREVQVKLFGGADVLPLGPAVTQRPTIGKQNCDVAIEVLRAERFEVVASSLGGTTGRALEFFTTTGEVRLRWLIQNTFTEEACS